MPTDTATRRPRSVEVRRLLAGVPQLGEWVSLQEHRATYARPADPSRRPLWSIIESLEAAGLRGRGGAGFPTGTKWRAVATGKGRPVVVANGTEGEPASAKDAVLMATQPHLVLDGCLLAAAAVGADRIELCVDGTNRAAIAGLERAVAEREVLEPGNLPISLIATPPRFVAGEETVLVNFVNGGPALPTMTPPRVFERGVAKRPTLVQNVETLAHAVQIVNAGPEWFRAVGDADEPGTVLVTITGGVERPGVREVPIGTRLDKIVAAAKPTSPVGAALVGGFFGTWVAAPDLQTPLSRAGLAAVGASPGCGVVIALPADACGFTETVNILRWFAAETAGQCGPCVFGLPAIAAEARALSNGAGDLTRLQRWAAQVDGRGACRHPDGAVRLLRSALTVFADDINDHLHGFPCAGADGAPTIAVPR